ncbi:MAG TPA: ATP-binding protein [Nocardioidaceae bacterium]|nr:ATP-binding protein [Nocardioidaceae bacterium]
MDEAESWSHETELAAVPASVSTARGFIHRHLEEHDLAHLQDDVRLVASELVTNALVHAGTGFLVTLRGTPGRVLLTVQDGSSAVPVRPPAGLTLEPGGRGLAIVAELSDEWGVIRVHGRAKSVWASFATSPDPVLAQ